MIEVAMNTVVLYATDTMADWEYAYVTAGLSMAIDQQPGRWALRVLADRQDQVVTLGGIRLVPDGDLDTVDVEELSLLLLPGANTWDSGHDRALDLATQLVQRDLPVAAICGATYGIARAGLLDQRRHTSNAPEYLQASGYGGAQYYSQDCTVDDGGVITAPATAPVDFAAAIFRRIELFPTPVIDAWYGLYTTGERRYYDALVGGQG